MEDLNRPSSEKSRSSESREEVTDLEEELTMAIWSNDELHKIVETEDLHISPFRGWSDIRHSDMGLVGCGG